MVADHGMNLIELEYFCDGVELTEQLAQVVLAGEFLSAGKHFHLLDLELRGLDFGVLEADFEGFESFRFDVCQENLEEFCEVLIVFGSSLACFARHGGVGDETQRSGLGLEAHVGVGGVACVAKLLLQVVLLLAEDQQSLVNFGRLVLLPVLEDLVQRRQQLVRADPGHLPHLFAQGLREHSAVQALGYLLDFAVFTHDQELGTRVCWRHQSRGTELVAKQVLGLELDSDGKDELLLVLAEDHPVLGFEQLDASLVHKIRQKLAVVLAEESRHEQVYVEAYHFLARIAKVAWDVSGQL